MRPGTPPTTQALDLLAQAVRLQVQEQFAPAADLYFKALHLAPNLKGVHFQLGVLHFQMNDLQAARQELEKSIALGEQVYEATNLLGVIDSRQGQPAKAISRFEAASKLSPGDPQAFYDWSETLREQGDPKGAIPLLRKAIQRNPQDPLYAFKLRMARIDAGDVEQIVADLPQQMKMQPPAGDWLMTAAAVKLQRGDEQTAAMYLDAARDRMDHALFFGMLQDPFFLLFKDKPLIAPFYQVTITTGPATQTSN